MLHLLDATLEAYFRGELSLGSDVDIAHEAPDSNWSARVTRPTLNLFVWDIRRNVSEAGGGMDLIEDEHERFRRPMPPRIDFRYLITTWTATVRDEHALLGSTLIACLRTPLIPEHYLQGSLAEVTPPPRIQVARWDGGDSGEFWNAMGGQLKAALDVIVSASVDTAILLPAGPPVRSVDLASAVSGTDATSRQARAFGHMEGDTDEGAAGDDRTAGSEGTA